MTRRGQLGRTQFHSRRAPLMESLPVSMADSLSMALRCRPDISRSIREVRAAATRLGVGDAMKLLPKLDFVASTDVAGLAGGTWVAEFSEHSSPMVDPATPRDCCSKCPLGNRAHWPRKSADDGS